MRPRQQSRRTKSMQRPDGAQLAHTAPENVYDVPDDDGGRVLSESASGEASSVEYDTGGQTSDGAADAGVTDNEHESNSAVGERSTEALLPVAKGDHVDSVEDMPSIEDSELLGDTWFINDITDFGAGIEEMGSDDLLEAIEGMEEGTFSDMPMIDQMLQLQLAAKRAAPNGTPAAEPRTTPSVCIDNSRNIDAQLCDVPRLSGSRQLVGLGGSRIESKCPQHAVTDRPRRVFGRAEDHLARDAPELVFMLGNWRKVAALRELAVERRVYSRIDGEVHLLAGSLSGHVGRSLLVAETDVGFRNKVSRGTAFSRCHELTRRGLAPAAHRASDESVMNWMINRLVLPFAGVVCVFISDLGGIRGVARHLDLWLENGLPSDSPVLPWLLLVDDGSEKRSKDLILKDLYRFMRGAAPDEHGTPTIAVELMTRFAGIRVASLNTAAHARKQPQWDEFRDELADLVDKARENRTREWHLYTGEHLCELMNHTAGLISLPSAPAPLDFVSVTRSRRPVPGHLESVLTDFLGCIDSFELLLSFAVPVIASSIIFDHYMTRMHDGGGANAGVPLAALKALDERLGAISAWGLALGLSVQDCIVLVDTMAKHTFQGRDVSAFPLGRTSVGQRLLRGVITLLTDSKYSSANLETALKAVFGEARMLSDWTIANEMGLHVGFPVVTAEDTATLVVANDGGTGDPEDAVANFQILESKDVPLWQALRATTAAPFYFNPQVIDDVAYQDGGMTYNNPSALALAAARSQCPEKPNPGLFLSFGTGVGRMTKRSSRSVTDLSGTVGGRVQKRKKRSWLRVVHRSSVGRVCGAFMRQNDSNREFERVCQHIRGGHCFRFDPEHDGPQPNLDDIADLQGRQRRAEAAASSAPEIRAAASCILAQRFYFELDSIPHYSNGMYHCSGGLHCDFEPGSPEQTALLHRFDQAAASFQLGSQIFPGPFLRRATRQSDSTLVRRVIFSVRTKQTEFSIEIQERPDESVGISGSPFTIDRLVQLQGLDDWFGGGYE
ncbi:hypothetical protein MY8738_006314 [Beauveria namnaoensis]